jgi:hypothetical protein
VAATVHEPPVPRGLFIIFMVMTIIVGFTFMRKAYASPVLSALILLLLSYGMVQLLSKLFYGFWAIKSQYPSFTRGDLIWLPLFTAVPLSLLISHLPTDRTYWFQTWWWSLGSAVFAVGLSTWFWFTQHSAFPSAVMGSPPKLWHDLVVYPLFSFFLFNAAPALWYSNWGLHGLKHGHVIGLLFLLPLLGVGLWTYDGVVSDRKLDRDAPSDDGPLVDASRGYDWETSEVSGRLIMVPDGDDKFHWELPADFVNRPRP